MGQGINYNKNYVKIKKIEQKDYTNIYWKLGTQ